jgi:ABC-2 type transport system permease protein
MARLLVQLKLRLLRNALRSSTPAKVSFIVSSILALLVAAGTFTVLALVRGSSASVDVATVIFTVFSFGWLFAPILTFGLDGTLDPASLALYPLRTRPLAVGLLAASATGAWPAANVIGLLGVTVGVAHGVSGVVVAVVAVALQVLFCIALARLVTTRLAGLLRSRRGRDLAVFLVIPLFALYELFTQVVPKEIAQGSITTSSLAGVDSWLRWLPPGLAVHAIQDASDGRPGTAAARLALLAAIVVVLAWLWVRSLDQSMITADSTTQSSRAHGGSLPLARYGLRGTVAARLWVYQRRDPVSLLYWAIPAVIMVAVSIKAIIGPNTRPQLLLAGAIFGTGFLGYVHANPVGLSGPPFLFEALALTGRRQLRAFFSGQNVVYGVIAVPLLAALSFGLAAVSGRPWYGFLAFAVALAGLGGALALGNILSVALPYPMVQRAGNPTRQAAQGYGGQVFGCVMGSLAAAGVAATPVLFVIAATDSVAAAIRMPLLVLCTAGYALALTWAGVRMAALLAENKLPELVQIAMHSKL